MKTRTPTNQKQENRTKIQSYKAKEKNTQKEEACSTKIKKINNLCSQRTLEIETRGIWRFYLEWYTLGMAAFCGGEEFDKNVGREEGSLRVVWWLLFLTWVVPQTMEKLASVSVKNKG
jgi:hypothetical protein